MSCFPLKLEQMKQMKQKLEGEEVAVAVRQTEGRLTLNQMEKGVQVKQRGEELEARKD
jgi:hypothetical protein